MYNANKSMDKNLQAEFSTNIHSAVDAKRRLTYRTKSMDITYVLKAHSSVHESVERSE